MIWIGNGSGGGSGGGMVEVAEVDSWCQVILGRPVDS